MSPVAPVPLVRCIFRATTEDGYRAIMGKPPGAFSLQAEVAKAHATLALHQVLPGTDAYPPLHVADLVPATLCSLSADDAVTMVVLPPALASVVPSAEAAEASAAEPRSSHITVRMNGSLRGTTALASQATLDALLVEDECVMKMCGGHYDCVFVVEKVESAACGGASCVLEVGPELFRNLRAAACGCASQLPCSDGALSLANTQLSLPLDSLVPLEDEGGDLLLRAAVQERHRLRKLVLCPALDDATLAGLYGLYYPDLCALFSAASAAMWEGRLVGTGDVLLLELAAFADVAHRLDGVDVLESVARVLSHKVRSWRGMWADEQSGASPHLLALRVVRVEEDGGPVPFSVVHPGSMAHSVEVVLVHQRNYPGCDVTPVFPPARLDRLASLDVFARVSEALRCAAAPSFNGGLHTFVVHGVKENLARELVDCALRQLGLASVVVAADGLEEADLEDAVVSFIADESGGSTALVVHNAHVIASAAPHLLSLLDERSGAAVLRPRLIVLVCEAMEAVPPMIAARATNAEGVLECGNPSEADRAAFIAPLLDWACERHRVHASVLLTAKTFAGWTVGLTYADIAALVEECARVAALAVPAVTDAGFGAELRGVMSDVSCEAIVQGYMKAHGYNMVSTKLQPVRWSDVGGLEEAKRELRETIQLPILHPELFENGTKKRTGVLFYGPPGCGKTLLAKAVATEMNMNFMSVKGPELINQYVGESEKNIRQLFQRARDNSPCIVFFDELDALAPARGAKGDAGGVMDRIVSQLLVEVDGVGQKRSDGTASGDVFIIGATNRPDLLDAALLRPGRFDRLCYLGIPSTREEQLFALRALTRKFDMADDVRLEAVLEPLDYVYTGADFFALCSDAMMFAVEDALESVQGQLDAALHGDDAGAAGSLPPPTPEEESKPIKVCMEHFLRARAQLKPSVTKADLHKYETLKQKFNK